MEEEGNKHVEEEIEVEEKEEEKREWEELSEKAQHLVWVIEKMKNRREGKKNVTWKMIQKEKEEMEKRVVEAERGREEEKKKREEAELKMERIKIELEEMKKKEGVLHTQTPSNTPPITPNAFSVITSLDGTSVIFPEKDGIKREGNTIIPHGSKWAVRNCFIGGEMTSV